MKNSYKLSTVLLAALLLMIIPSTILAQDAENMSLLGNWGIGGGEIRAVSNQGDLVYYGVGNVLKIVSFEDPANPFAAGSVILDDMVEDIVWTVIDGKTYCLVSGSSLNIVDVTNPITPSLTASMSLAGYGEGLAVSGTYAYIAAGSSGMQVINISNPASPDSVTTVAGSGSGYAEGINVSSPYAYLGNGANVTIYDINTPETPSIVGTYEGTDWVQDAVGRGNYLYVCEWGVGVDVVDISNPASPTFVTTFSNPKNADIMFDGDFGYIASRDGGLTVIDVSSPAAPTLVNTFTTQGTLRKVSYGAITISSTVTGHIFTAEVSGLGAVDVSSAATGMDYSARIAVTPPAEGIAYSALVMGTKAYVPYGSAGMRILDVTNPGAMTELGHFTLGTNSRKVVVKDNIAFLADKSFGVFVLDVTDPGNIDSLTSFADAAAQDIGISGDYVYAAVRDLGIAVIDASTANAPTLVTHLSSFWGEGVAVDGNVMAQSTWDKIYFYDITNPAAPVMADSLILVTGTGEFGISGDYAYIHDFDTLRVIDISDLSNVVEVGKAFTGGSWDGTAFVEADIAYVNCESNGIKMFDVSDKTAPTEIGHWDGVATARNIFVLAGTVYVAEKEGGLSIYGSSFVAVEPAGYLPRNFTLSQNFPNPFNPSTVIEYGIPEALGSSDVRLEVFNVLGQSVQTLVNQKQLSGTYRVRWDGHNNAGKQQVGGVYIYRLTVGQQTLTNKMILLK
ncbi:MAG: T9SS type A sorting domain-containing protein [Candidatus Marinimicrobia bacterium]|nr:T9SS type A sorting domain-containing protein [Candidatus Neomarinimicrobiota bacterium]